jgi:hypothetical protein
VSGGFGTSCHLAQSCTASLSAGDAVLQFCPVDQAGQRAIEERIPFRIRPDVPSHHVVSVSCLLRNVLGTPPRAAACLVDVALGHDLGLDAGADSVEYSLAPGVVVAEVHLAEAQARVPSKKQWWTVTLMQRSPRCVGSAPMSIVSSCRSKWLAPAMSSSVCYYT